MSNLSTPTGVRFAEYLVPQASGVVPRPYVPYVPARDNPSVDVNPIRLDYKSIPSLK